MDNLSLKYSPGKLLDFATEESHSFALEADEIGAQVHHLEEKLQKHEAVCNRLEEGGTLYTMLTLRDVATLEKLGVV